MDVSILYNQYIFHLLLVTFSLKVVFKELSDILIQDPNGELDSGEKTYFPALHVGLNKSSAVVCFLFHMFLLLHIWSMGILCMFHPWNHLICFSFECFYVFFFNELLDVLN